MQQHPIAWLLSAVPGWRRVGPRPLRDAARSPEALLPPVAPAKSTTARVNTPGHEEMHTSSLAMDYAGSISLDRLSAVEKERLEFELQLSAEVQQALLPRQALDVPGLDVAAFSRPATIVGGDLFDFYRFRDGAFGLLIADVAGHGLAASLIMANLQAALQLLVPEHDAPDEVVRRLNRLFYHNFDMTSFVSLFLGHFDPLTRVLTYCNAGHNPPLLYRSGTQGEVATWLQPSGAAVGLTAGQVFAARSIVLAPGDLLLLYTDGVTESIDVQGEEFGPGRLVEIVAREPDVGARAIVRRVRSRLLAFAGGRPLADDATLVACQILTQ